jgi:hypothetical protein
MPSSISTVRWVGIALVVDAQRAAPVGDGAVIDHGDALGRHALADAAGKGGTALAVEVAFEAVADRFVQQDAGPAGAEHHRHFAGRRRFGGQVDAGLMHRALGIVAQHRIAEVGVVEAPAAARGTLLAPPLFFHDHGHRHPHQGPHVGRHAAVGTRHQHHFPGAGNVGHDFAHPRVEGPRHGFEAFQQLDLGGVVERGDRVAGGIQRGRGLAGAQHRCQALGAGGGDGTGCRRPHPAAPSG